MKQLLFVANHAGFFLSHRLPIAIAARERGWEVHVATPKSKHVPRIVEHGLAWHEVRLSRSDVHPFEELRTIADLARLYRRLRPDLVHHVTAKPVLYGTFVARLTGVPAVINAVSGLGIVFAGESSPRLRLLQRLISIGYRVALRHPRMRVIFQNEEHRAAFIANRWVAAKDAVLIAGAGVDMQEFAPKPRPDDDGPVRVVLATRMLFTKGIAEFVEAARLLRARGANVRMSLVGEPDPANPGSVPLETLQRWHDEGAVVYRGRSEEMPSVFAEADIVALPTYYGEGLPKVLIEAAACGLPIVTTDWPGCREVVRDGENGLLVPIRDAAKLADAIERLARDPELRRRMGERGRERAIAEWSLESVVAQTLALYPELA
ncbi:MAG TPA: glycosyltransferase family 4 protein [Thermoanaerobaculia bacterium]|nr:glycosyltransferase family 4 protein [Thermoanaerobaculia bacterium]